MAVFHSNPERLIPRTLRAAACAALCLVALGSLGCTAVPCGCDRAGLAGDVLLRSGHALGPAACPGEFILPNGASLEDGLTEDEAVLLALWNNAAFAELLTEIGIAQGDLVQAGLLPNPEVVYFFPLTDKPYKYLLEFPVEALWLRPIRMAAAESESYRVCQRLSQAALDLIRDARQAHADVLLAAGRLRVGDEAVRIRQKIATLAAVRLEAGDISAQELATARIDALAAEQELLRLRPEIAIAQERLRNLLGLGLDRAPLELIPAPAPPPGEFDADLLAAAAAQSRPDALAAAENAAAAAARLRLAETSWFRVLGILDATSGTSHGHEFGPALRLTLPVFQHNQGGIARARAEWERAERQRATVRDRILQDVYQAHERYEQVRVELAYLRGEVIPAANAAIARAELAYREGDAPYVVALQTTQQLLSSHFRREQLTADLQRAWAELERSVGRKLDTEREPSAPTPESLPDPPT